MPRTSAFTTTSISLVRSPRRERELTSNLSGNFADSSTAVFVWNGETEEWGFGEGYLQEDLGFYAASLVPSETLDYCLEPPAESTTYGPYIKKEDRAEPLKRIRDMMKKRKDNTD